MMKKVFHMMVILSLFGGSVMAHADEVLLQGGIEPDQVLKTVDLYSEEKSLGASKGLQRIMTGEVTIGMPVVEKVLRNHGKADSVHWDYYSISLPFTLHRLEGNRYYESAIFQVTLNDSQITATALFPTDITAETKIEKKLSLSPEFKISYRQAEAGINAEKESSKEYIVLAPCITAFGKGQQQFYWEYKQFREQPVFPGDKQAVVVLRVPRGMTQVSAQLDYEAVVAETLFGIVYKKNIKSGVLPVSWKLPKS